MEQQFLENLYNGTLSTFLIGFSEEEKTSILSSYKQYIIDSYSNVLEPGDDVSKVTQIFIDLENKKWKNKTKEEKQIIVIRDQYLDHLQYLSNTAFKYAETRLGIELTGKEYVPVISQEQAEKYLQEMENCIEKIQPHNLKIARNYISEGTTDFMYAANLTNNMSLRTSRLK